MAGVLAVTTTTLGIAGVAWNPGAADPRSAAAAGLTDIAEAIRWAAGLPVRNPDRPNTSKVINLSSEG
jgi:hypothetical protein